MLSIIPFKNNKIENTGNLVVRCSSAMPCIATAAVILCSSNRVRQHHCGSDTHTSNGYEVPNNQLIYRTGHQQLNGDCFNSICLWLLQSSFRLTAISAWAIKLSGSAV
jgi:hypothetical protein